MIIKLLKWDSDFFKKRIASASIGSSEQETDVISEILSYKNSYDLVYINAPGDYFFSNDILTQQNILHVDSKIIYYGIIENVKSDFDSQISVYSSKEVNPDLLSLSLQSGAYSRYKDDKNFTNNEFEGLYTKWIENSINGSIADAVLVYKDSDRITGMVTVSIDKVSDFVKIGLIAVDQSAQNKGIGSKLMGAVKTYASSRSLRNIEVATQLENKQACTFYEKCGLSIKSKTNIYHFWINDRLKLNK